MAGHTTLLRLPRVLDTLEALPRDRAIELDLSALRHLDHSCRTALQEWAGRHDEHGVEAVRVPESVLG
ncbi:hypothetical protein [Kitasatospora sp. NPDC093679]|uniref:hypothetical protein n=1 Tax=Kitasatospora sp. NPDC093679 TaxID=3154983 RepID=UPI00341762C2